MSRPSPLDRVHQTRRLLRTEGCAGVAGRLVDRVAARVAPPGGARTPVDNADLERIAAIAAAGWVLPPPLPAEPGQPLEIAWVAMPPGPGSGGHTTMFRLMSALEQAGHRCVLYLRDEHGWALDQHKQTIRSWWPWLHAEVRDAAAGIEDAHAIFATAWDTAYTVLASPARGQRFYLVQDFEPSLYPAGTESLLAEATYRFGFHGVTAGVWLAQRLERDYGMATESFDFGRDPTYALDDSLGPEERTGLCFYSRPDTPRRAFQLGALALALFAKRHPEVQIHLFGVAAKRLPFAATNHGLCSPEQLNWLYNRCVAGLVLSATNTSLIPHEMLAAGCIPVVNDAEQNRAVLNNSEVVYAPATPFELAQMMCAPFESSLAEREAAASSAAASVEGASWDDEGAAVVRIVERVVTGKSGEPAPRSPPVASSSRYFRC